MVKDRWCDQTERLGSLQTSSLVSISRLHSAASTYSLRCNVGLRSHRGRLDGSHLCSQLGPNDRKIWGCSHSNSVAIQSLTRQLVSYIYCLTTFTRHMRRRSQKTMKKFSRTCGFPSNPARPGSPTTTSYDAVADVVRVRCSSVAEGEPVKV